jgi:hypothetical protein
MTRRDKRSWIEFHKTHYKDFHQNDLKRLQQWIDNVKNDPDNKNRLKDHTCRYCFYHPPKMALQAFTNSNCKDCEVTMSFPSSLTDDFCKPCAERNEVCKHCGAEMD